MKNSYKEELAYLIDKYNKADNAKSEYDDWNNYEFQKNYNELGDLVETYQSELNQNKAEFDWDGKTFDEYIKESLEQALDDYVGVKINLSELSWELTSRENTDGTMFYSIYKSTEFIHEYFYEIGEVYEQLQEELGDLKINPFTEPEKLTVMIYIEKVRDILSESEFINEHWYDEIELTQEISDLIKGQVEITSIEEDQLEFMRDRIEEQLEQVDKGHQQE